MKFMVSKNIVKEPSLIEKNKVKYIYCRELISDTIGLSPEQIELIKFEVGCEFIEEKLNEDVLVAQDVKYTKGFFWPWFMNQWHLRDEEFVLSYHLESYIPYLHELNEDERMGFLRAYCEWHHEAMKLAPMQNGFDAMLSKLIKYLRQ